MKKVNWMNVWNGCAPFVFANIAIWFFVWFVMPSQQQFATIQNQQDNEVSRLTKENENLKENYKKLINLAKSKINQMEGRNQELDRLLAEWQNKAVILEMNKTDLFTPLKENITLEVFLPKEDRPVLARQ